jgi:hypothetical protein
MLEGSAGTSALKVNPHHDEHCDERPNPAVGQRFC